MITISKIELSWDQVWKVLTIIGGGIVAAYGAGWLFIPAKESELREVREVVQTIREEQKGNKVIFQDLTLAINELRNAVADVQRDVRDPAIPQPNPAVTPAIRRPVTPTQPRRPAQ